MSACHLADCPYCKNDRLFSPDVLVARLEAENARLREVLAKIADERTTAYCSHYGLAVRVLRGHASEALGQRPATSASEEKPR